MSSLRHLEYYAGILFLTTNRVTAFDEAFLSRIHVALHFKELSDDARKQVWTAFFKKLGMAETITDEQLTVLAQRDINGRQIKNAARTAHSLSVGLGEKLEFRHFVHTLDVMGDFTREFERHSGIYS
jgi:SpoVK/Ycf46/Vps4 family AAA+-type ATPase